MSIENLTENDDDELIPVETPVEDTPVDAAAEDESDDDDGAEDERLAASDDDHDEEVTSANRNKRKKRRDLQRRARERAEAEIEYLRLQNLAMERRLAAVEGRAAAGDVSSLEQQLAQALQEVQQAEHIFARATEAGNGEDAVAAMRIRDDARAKAMSLQQQRQMMSQQTARPQVGPQVATLAQQWTAANPWYDPQGRDRDSATAKAIDAQLAREGFNPATREYWEELTARVADALGEDDAQPASRQADSKPRRKAPPTGNTREHVPPSTRKEIFVTPERKQAMIEAGVWDDPTLRQRYLKAYRAYDQTAAR